MYDIIRAYAKNHQPTLIEMLASQSWRGGLTLLLLYLICLMGSGEALLQKNLTRTICYSGSNIYQGFTQVCQQLNPGYKGDWYCTKMDVCEFGISPNRLCMSTK